MLSFLPAARPPTIPAALFHIISSFRAAAGAREKLLPRRSYYPGRARRPINRFHLFLSPATGRLLRRCNGPLPAD